MALYVIGCVIGYLVISAAVVRFWVWCTADAHDAALVAVLWPLYVAPAAIVCFGYLVLVVAGVQQPKRDYREWRERVRLKGERFAAMRLEREQDELRRLLDA